MKTFTLLLLAACAFAFGGCARSTVESRKQERYAAYAGLPDDSRALVDQGKIKIGMTPDAAYIAWGKPAEILEGETPDGRITTWVYHGAYFEEYRYWSYQTVYHRDGYTYPTPYLQHDYLPRSYVKAEVRFKDGAVSEWQMFARPTY